MIRLSILIISFKLLFLITIECISQNISEGNHFIQNFNHKDYHSPENQTWAILQDQRGFMYFGNNRGILEFDGINWRLIQLSNKSTARSLALDTTTNTIYVGGVGEVGYLKADSTGLLKYHSLLDKIPEEHRVFKDVWQTAVLEDKIIFRTTISLFIVYENKVKVLTPEDRFHRNFFVNNQYYIREWGKGLLKLNEKDSLEYIGQSNLFADKRIYVMLPYENNKLLIATREDGIYIYNPHSLTSRFIKPNKFKTVNSFLTENQTYCGIKIQNDLFVTGTFQNGLIVYDKNGEIKYHINKHTGLEDDNVLFLFHDSQNNIWAGLNDGISFININSTYSFYDDKNGLNGTVYNTITYKNKLYSGTSLGLFVMDKNNNFSLIKNTKGQSWGTSVIDGNLYLAHSDGLFKIVNDEAELILNHIETCWNITAIENTQKALVSTNNGIILLNIPSSNQEYTYKKISGFNESTRYLVHFGKNIWVSNPTKGVYRMILNDQLDSITQIDLFGVNQGLPSDINNYVFKLKDHNENRVVIGTERGIYKFDYNSDTFMPDSSFSVLFNRDGFIDKFVQNNNGNIYYQQGKEKGILKPVNGNYKLLTRFIKLQDVYLENVSSIDSNILLCTRDGIIKYNPNLKFSANKYPTYIREVIANDSLIYGGYKTIKKEIVLPFKYNNLSFSYSALFYEDHNKISYSFKLEGYDEEWSEWTTRTEKEYTNLPNGNYSFKVKAINTYNTTSNVARFNFRILTPWYRSMLAYIFYITTSILIVWVIIKLFTNKLKIEKEVLEGIVQERTHDLQEINTQLEEKQADLEIKQEEIKDQAKILAKTNRELEKHKNHLEKLVEDRTHDLKIAKEKAEESDRLKTAFLANMSHEIRTPMNAIIGFADLLNEPDIELNIKEELINLINHNSDTLLRLIDDIIDISKIESGQLVIKKRLCSITEILDKMLKTFIEKKVIMKKDHVNLKLKANEEYPEIKLDTDPLRFQQIITNFIDNALKFTEKGEIIISYEVNRDKNSITFFVKDTGIGLKKEEADLIFERFSKIENDKTKLYRGAGLGLTISKNLAHLLDGEIGVESEFNKGSTFYFKHPFKHDK